MYSLIFQLLCLAIVGTNFYTHPDSTLQAFCFGGVLVNTFWVALRVAMEYKHAENS